VTALALIALGIVYGDIGTSPLYAFQLTLQALGHSTPTANDAMGIVSLIFWSLLLIPGFKYCMLVLRADNHGEGGILALASLIAGTQTNTAVRRIAGVGIVSLLGIVGSALLMGDGVITPAISVLSAMEGIKVLTPDFASVVLPFTLALLVALFSVQRFGTGKIGKAFGPIMLTWFGALAVIGVYRIIGNPGVIAAVNPVYAYHVLISNPGVATAIFGAVFLALTGGEAMYADMGHVGAPAIRKAFIFVVLPSLLLNYFGQAALIMTDPTAMDNPFYKAAPGWALAPMIFLAAAATIIASQALISGVFSLTRQAIQFDLMPKMLVNQTSSHEFGQIYVPAMNWILALGTLLVVVTFRSSDALGAAYGVAVSGTMLITTLLLAKVMTAKWGWSPIFSVATVAFFGLIDLGFFASNSVKIVEGGWLPLSIAAVVTFIMISCKLGKTAVNAELNKRSVPVESFVAKLDELKVQRVPGLAAWLTKTTDGIGPIVQGHVLRNKCLHEHVVLFSVETARVPKVVGPERLEIEILGHGLYRMKFKVGFMQTANVHAAICAEFRALARVGLVPHGIEHDLHIFIGNETLKRKAEGAAVNWLSWAAFVFMKKLAARSTDFFKLPRDLVEERGIFLEI
jgi:KUP system potassium uptake protein